MSTATRRRPGAAGAAPGGNAAGGPAGGAGTAGGPVPAGDWRRWRAPAALAVLILAGGVVIALLQVGPPVKGPLDPNDTGPPGAHAVAALLTNRGQAVIRTDTVPAATAPAGGPGSTVVVTSPQTLTRAQLAGLARLPASLLVVAPGQAALRVLAPGVRLAGLAPVASERPACGLPAARLAGSAEMGGLLLRFTAPGAWHCYPGGRGDAGGRGDTSLVRYASGGRTITVLGTGTPLSNQSLGRDGNAALALNLLGGGPRIVWLVPGPAPGAGAAAGRGPLTRLIPRPVYLVTIELGVAVLLAALWRMRRFGPLVFEPLPVTVRASETVEGHGRLYRPRDVPPETVCQELARRTGRDPGQIRQILFGPVPPSDAALVALAADLDSLEGQVLNP